MELEVRRTLLEEELNEKLMKSRPKEEWGHLIKELALIQFELGEC